MEITKDTDLDALVLKSIGHTDIEALSDGGKQILYERLKQAIPECSPQEYELEIKRITEYLEI